MKEASKKKKAICTMTSFYDQNLWAFDLAGIKKIKKAILEIRVSQNLPRLGSKVSGMEGGRELKKIVLAGEACLNTASAFA